MKFLIYSTLSLILLSSVIAQNAEDAATFYIGVSYGTSFAIGDFADTDVNNFDAGFAENGQKIDLYGGYFLDDKWTLTATFRYQSFETNLNEAISQYGANNPSASFSGSSVDWETYYFMLGVAYKIRIIRNLAIYPRVGLGPMWATNPGVSVTSDDPSNNQNYTRSSETGLGLGGEVGIGLRKDLGKHFSLMPTFTISGGFVNYSNVETRLNNINIVNNYEPRIESFTLGIALSYRFY